MLGSMKEKFQMSAQRLVPNREAINISRAKPQTRESVVITARMALLNRTVFPGVTSPPENRSLKRFSCLRLLSACTRWGYTFAGSILGGGAG
jgi:hypothetical protein